MLGLDKYLLLGGAVLLLGAGLVITYQTNKIDNLEAANAQLEANVAAKETTIAAQTKSIADMITASKAAEAEIRAAGDTIDTLTADLAAARSRRNAKVETDYALPSCAALLATDLASMCPAHAQRLRDAATVR